MKKNIYQVDSFTDIAFKGNPAGVVFVGVDTSEQWMQNIAMEMNLSETAFLIEQIGSYKIRYFTPTEEIPLCGHATLASAHIIYELGIKKQNETITFNSKVGDLIIRKEGSWIKMNFPVYKTTKIEINTQFKDLVGFEPLEMYESNNWVIAIAKNETEIKNAKPKFESLIQAGLGHLIITAKSEMVDIDFVHRCFVPLVGINEDPVTGSAQCALGPLWNHKTGKVEFNAIQLSERTGFLKLKMNKDSVDISGKAKTVFKAECYV